MSSATVREALVPGTCPTREYCRSVQVPGLAIPLDLHRLSDAELAVLDAVCVRLGIVVDSMRRMRDMERRNDSEAADSWAGKVSECLRDLPQWLLA